MKKTDKPLARLIKKKKKRHKIRKEREVTTDTPGTQRIIRDNYGQSAVMKLNQQRKNNLPK